MPTSVASPHPSNLIEPELPKSEQVAGVAGRGGPSVEASHRTGAQHAPTAPIRGDGRGRHTAGARITRRGHGAGGQGAAGRIPPRAADRVRARPRGWRLAPPHPCLNAGFYRACTRVYPAFTPTMVGKICGAGHRPSGEKGKVALRAHAAGCAPLSEPSAHLIQTLGLRIARIVIQIGV